MATVPAVLKPNCVSVGPRENSEGWIHDSPLRGSYRLERRPATPGTLGHIDWRAHSKVAQGRDDSAKIRHPSFRLHAKGSIGFAQLPKRMSDLDPETMDPMQRCRQPGVHPRVRNPFTDKRAAMSDGYEQNSVIDAASDQIVAESRRDIAAIACCSEERITGCVADAIEEIEIIDTRRRHKGSIFHLPFICQLRLAEGQDDSETRIRREEMASYPFSTPPRVSGQLLRIKQPARRPP
jgi:hypothetical protein